MVGVTHRPSEILSDLYFTAPFLLVFNMFSLDEALNRSPKHVLPWLVLVSRQFSSPPVCFLVAVLLLLAKKKACFQPVAESGPVRRADVFGPDVSAHLHGEIVHARRRGYLRGQKGAASNECLLTQRLLSFSWHDTKLSELYSLISWSSHVRAHVSA